MGLRDIFQNAKNWVTDKSNTFLHGEDYEPYDYYGSDEEAREYASLNEEPAQEAQPQEGYYQAPFAQQVQQPQQGGWQGTYQPQQPAYQQQAQQMQQNSWQTNYQPQEPQTQPQSQWQQAQYQQEQYQKPQQASQPQQPDHNVVAFPGTFQAANGRAYAHIERVTQLVSRENCYTIIDFMKNGESVILNIESIQSEQEVQHCVDLLSGAAYTLGCTITKLSSQRRCYLIAPPTVQVLPDEFTQKLNVRRSAGRPGRSRSYAENQAQQPQPTGYEAPSRSPFARPSFPPRPSYQRQENREENYYDNRNAYEQPLGFGQEPYREAAYGGY